MRLTLALVLSIALLVPASAHAWSTPKEKAQALFKEGKAAYDKAHYPEALARFQAASKLLHRASLLIMTARTYRRLNRTRMALEYYSTYKSVWQQENPGKASPHADEVREQIAALSQITGLVKEAGIMLRKGLRLEALDALNQALKSSTWPLIYEELARCYLALKRPDRATSSLKVALSYWEGFRLGWKTRHPDTAPPDDDHVEARIKELKVLEQAIEQSRNPAPQPAPGPKEPAPAPATTPGPDPDAPQKGGSRSPLLLGVGISTLALALGFEALAWVAYVEAENLYKEDPDFEKYKSLNLAAHVMAGAMAIAAGVSFYFWYVSDDLPPGVASMGVLPLPGGAAASATFRF